MTRLERSLLVVGGLAASTFVGGAATAQTAPVLQPWELRYVASVNFHLDTLKAVHPVDPPQLGLYVRDRGALRQLGKALFWDAQVGSDGQACASCHFHAGADNRSRNQLDPGLRSTLVPGGDTRFGNSPLAPASRPSFGPNRQLTAADFPLHKLADPADRASALLSDTNDIVSSQGVFAARLVRAVAPYDVGVPQTASGPGAIFQVSGVQVRNVEPRNTPTVVNAIFNQRSFWDARARDEFNGIDPIGQLDPGAQVVEAVSVPGLSTGAFLHAVRITAGALASQADGPPLSDMEMSFSGRRFADLGRKLLQAQVKPLALQLVATDDSVLGPLSAQRARAGARGLAATYQAMIQAAFLPQWWDGGAWRVDLSGGTPVLKRGGKSGADQFTVAEYNFPLFFGLAVREYEATLVADDTPFDRFMEGDNQALSPAALGGLQLFLGKAGCAGCHGGPELTNAGITNITRRGLLISFGAEPNPDLLERMVMGDGGVAVYDAGHYNIGVRPIAEDLGLGATIGPLDLPLSNTRRLQGCLEVQLAGGATPAAAAATCKVPRILARPVEASDLLHRASAALGDPPAVVSWLAQADLFLLPNDPLVADKGLQFLAFGPLQQAQALLVSLAGGKADVLRLVDGAARLLPDPVDPGPDLAHALAPPLTPDERAAVDGAFKTPGLRNVALTAPFFHNGGQATLHQVVEFYDRGGDFHEANIGSLDPVVRRLGLGADERADLVAFLEALTDERVRWDRAPFDHPGLSVPNGVPAAMLRQGDQGEWPPPEERVELPAVGAGGSSVPLGTPQTPFAAFLDPLR
jgi:cytochrome c peroxidase